MSFRDIKGQDGAIDILNRSSEKNKVTHAYIFAGPAGVGKKLTALNFAKMLNCLAAAGERPCDECVSCRKIGASNHPDVFILRPEKEGSHLGIDEVRQVIKNIGLKPYEARMKVYIIDDAASLTQEAQNAILKTLEEPPSDSIIIFIVEKAEDLFPTIESRCQIVKFFPLKAEVVGDVLRKDHKIDDARAGVLSRIANGSLGLALKLDGERFLAKRAAVVGGLADGSFFDSDFETLTKPDMRSYLDTMLTWYRDILIAKTLPDGAAELLVNIDRVEAIRKEASRLDFDFLDNVIRQIILTGSFLEQNVNLKLAMSVLGANICTK